MFYGSTRTPIYTCSPVNISVNIKQFDQDLAQNNFTEMLLISLMPSTNIQMVPHCRTKWPTELTNNKANLKLTSHSSLSAKNKTNYKKNPHNAKTDQIILLY